MVQSLSVSKLSFPFFADFFALVGTFFGAAALTALCKAILAPNARSEEYAEATDNAISSVGKVCEFCFGDQEPVFQVRAHRLLIYCSCVFLFAVRVVVVCAVSLLVEVVAPGRNGRGKKRDRGLP